ncbi:MAG TPA: tetratricopeptide repeat protein [Gemmataceae bacterium]|nr:tetratricopeptide repeat protein [Gemmataceae bacterium]
MMTNRLRQPRFLLLFLLAGAALVLLGACYWPEWYLHSARQALERRDFVAAHADLERYLTARPNHAEAHLLVARLDRRANRYVEAAKHLDACRRLGGFADAVELERALIALQTGDFDARAEQICRRHAVRGDPEEFLILEALSQGYSKTYHLDDALFCLNRMLELQPNHGYALRRRAWIYSTLHDHQKAEADYRRALEIDAGDSVARLGLAQLLLEVRKDGAAAFEQFDHLWTVHKDSATTVGRARGLLLLGRTDEARQLLDDWLSGHSDDSAALTERGKLALEEKNVSVAESLLRRAVARAASNPSANHALYLCLVQQGKTSEAEQCQARFKQTVKDIERLDTLLQKLKKEPDDPDRRCQAAEIFLRHGQESEGERWLLATLRMHPDHGPSHRALADYYRRSGRDDLAELHQCLANAARPPLFRKP